MRLFDAGVGTAAGLGPVRVAFDEDDLAGARFMAERKVDMVNVHSPDGRSRDRMVRLRRLIAGKLADHAVKYLLTRYYSKRAFGFEVEEYDEVRTDGFRDPDPWDLRCVDPSGASLFVEVRSSFVHRLNDVGRLWTHDRQSLLGPYATSYKSMEAEKDVFWQVAFLRIPVDEPGGGVNRPFEGGTADLPLSAFIMGGGERGLFEEIGTTERDIADGAEYRVIRPMSAGRTVGQMLLLSAGRDPQ